MKKHSTCNMLYNELIYKYRDSNDYNAISTAWEKCFKSILSVEFGFNKNARHELFEWGKHCFNWEELHPDDSKTVSEYKVDFISDVAYCSDRMTLERLLRCHHQYRCMMRKVDAK